MGVRKVTVISSNLAAPKVIETEATNWAELKAALNRAGISTNNMLGMVGETENNLEVDTALLPAGIEVNGTMILDFTLFLFQKEAKSGLTDKEIDGMKYNALRAEVAKIKKQDKSSESFFSGLGSNPGGADIQKALKNYYKKNPASGGAPVKEAIKETPKAEKKDNGAGKVVSSVEGNTDAIVGVLEELISQSEQQIETMKGLIVNINNMTVGASVAQQSQKPAEPQLSEHERAMLEKFQSMKGKVKGR